MMKFKIVLLILFIIITACNNKIVDKKENKDQKQSSNKISQKVYKNKETELSILDQQIKQKVHELERKFKIGMNQSEMDRAFGTDFKVIKNPDSEDRTVEDRKYVFFEKEHSSSRQEYEIDLENLKNRNIGVQFFIGLTKDGSAQRASIIYIQEKDIMFRFISDQQDNLEKIN
jgi:hypothetical protein